MIDRIGFGAGGGVVGLVPDGVAVEVPPRVETSIVPSAGLTEFAGVVVAGKDPALVEIVDVVIVARPV